MATFRKRGTRWQVQIRKQGSPPLSRSFLQKRDAEAWARDIEARIERGGEAEARKVVCRSTVAELLIRYRTQVTPSKRSAVVEAYRIGRLLRDPIAAEFVNSLTTERVAAYRDDRLQTVSGETVRQDLVLLRQVIEIARKEWSLPIRLNPVDDVRKPSPAQPRNRRFTAHDEAALVQPLNSVRNPLVREVIAFAVATGMRRGELLRTEWRAIDRRNCVLLIPLTKNGHPRIIPLTSSALRILERVQDLGLPGELVFPITPNAFKLAWQRLVKAANVQNLRFHDLRHEAISSFFENGLSLPEVALISGHRDPRQLMRYTHLDASKIARKLNGL